MNKSFTFLYKKILYEGKYLFYFMDLLHVKIDHTEEKIIRYSDTLILTLISSFLIEMV